MKFQSEQANDAYQEILADVSERAIKMYSDAKSANVQDPMDAFHLNMAIEVFQHEGVARAIRLGVEVDSMLIGLKGAMVMASMKEQ